jgi:N-acetylglucosamine-6-phosphate deacetylase
MVMTGFAAMDRCAVLIEGGQIADVFSEKRFEQKHFAPDIGIIDVNGAYIAPGFIDTHTHGAGGFGTEDGTEESILNLSRFLVDQGVTAFNPTIYPSSPDMMLHQVRTISSAIGKEEGAQIMGIHLEGPFLSPDRLGAQHNEAVQPVNIQFMEQLWETSRGNPGSQDTSGRKTQEGHIVNMTVAPELKGMRELALFCVKKGIVLQAGHTDAKYENMVEGMQAGILHATHLFNAMSALDHRNPNAVGAVLIHPEMSCEIIADGFHVHPDLFKLLLRDKPIDKIILITDCLKPAHQQGESFVANGDELVFRDGVFRRKRDMVIAGSALTMIKGVQNLTCFGFSLEDAVKTASSNPAQVMRYVNKGAIIPGKDADLTVFDKDFNIKAVIIGGRIRKNTF